MDASKVIIPTIGRVVWFYPFENSAEAGFVRHGGLTIEPYTALITHVWSDRMVNLCVFDANGTPHGRTSVELVQDASTRDGGGYCTWMPFQKGQAQAQAKATETKVYADGTTATGVAPLPDASPTGAKAVSLQEARFGFGTALDLLDRGHRVARFNWNGKGMWIAMQRPDEHSKMRRSYLYMCPVDGDLVPWVASQSDLLADDWVLVE